MGRRAWFIGEGIIAIATIIFLFFLRGYGRILLDLREQSPNLLMWGRKAVQEPNYPWYFLLGSGFSILLLFYSVMSWKVAERVGSILWINIILNIVLLIILFSFFIDPIITALVFAMICYLIIKS